MSEKYMIHACQKRYWYVTDFLIPEMLRQGIKLSQITVALDIQGKGNLKMFIESLKSLPEEGTTWHLQDDVVISKAFKDVTSSNMQQDIICGFCSQYDNLKEQTVEPKDAWYSFQCIKIPNRTAHDFVSWMKEVGKEKHKDWYKANKYDDSFFHEYLIEKRIKAFNYSPNLVENIDYLLGGSVINDNRGFVMKSQHWNEHEQVDKVILQIEQGGAYGDIQKSCNT